MGKSYIGQSIDIERRWKEHIRQIGSTKNPLYLAMKKYGISAFDFKVLELCSEQELDNREMFYINKFKTYKNGYNLTIGGGGIKRESFKLISLIKQELTPIKLSVKQWLVYYYLMSICKWNGKDNERHYYIYKNMLNVSAASKLLGISRTTFYKALENLRESNIINEYDKYYIIQIPQIYAVVDQKTLTFLLQFQKFLGVELIRVYVVLNRIYQHQELEQQFNKATLISVLDHSIHDTSYYTQMELYLGFFSYWKIVSFTIEQRRDNTGLHKYYKINEINKLSEFEDFDIEVSAPIDKEFVETIKKEILELT